MSSVRNELESCSELFIHITGWSDSENIIGWQRNELRIVLRIVLHIVLRNILGDGFTLPSK